MSEKNINSTVNDRAGKVAAGIVETPSPRGAADGGGRPSCVPPRDPGSDWSVLMALAQQGDKAAYHRLLSGITPYLRRLASGRLTSPADAEDAVQEVLLTIHALRHTYDPGRPIGPWLATIARRKIIDRFRDSARKTARQAPLANTHETFSAVPANNYEDGVDHQVLREAIDNLPPGQREAIRLLKLQEMSLKEASAASGMSVGALKVATHRGLNALRKQLARFRK